MGGRGGQKLLPVELLLGHLAAIFGAKRGTSAVKRDTIGGSGGGKEDQKTGDSCTGSIKGGLKGFASRHWNDRLKSDCIERRKKTLPAEVGILKKRKSQGVVSLKAQG